MTRDRAAIFVGQTFGRLTVLDAGKPVVRRRILCRCECGSEKQIMMQSLRSGKSISCGCYRLERATAANTKHGQTKHPLFKTWNSMLQRCGNPNNHAYGYYGGRGISVCSEWAGDFGVFLEWARPSWVAGLTLDRIDPDGGYSPANCRWATRAEQMRNQRKTVKYPFNGEEMVATDIAKAVGLSPTTFSARIGQLGWTLEEAIARPSQRKTA